MNKAGSIIIDNTPPNEGVVAHRFSRKCSSYFQNLTYNQTIQKSMCITNPSKISDFRENLLHMLLFWILILFDSYAYSYKNRGCRMCNSPLFIASSANPRQSRAAPPAQVRAIITVKGRVSSLRWYPAFCYSLSPVLY